MSILSVHQSGLLLHIIGLTAAAGATLTGYVTSLKFLPQYKKNKEQGIVIMHTLSIFPRIAGIGLLLIILSGVLMISASGGGYGQMLWFRLKMIVVVLIIGTTLFVKRRLDSRLHKKVLEDTPHNDQSREIEIVTTRIRYVQLFLLSFFIIIFILSTFRFN